jgi:energy-coupling factor transporter ATP-binding protein EcfA2
VVLATHDLALAADLADRTVELRDGGARELPAATSAREPLAQRPAPGLPPEGLA